jgi:exodeoxyribonuclease VII small subunit
MDTQALETLSFEAALRELEILVRRLEEGQVNLEDAVSSYERGMTLKAICEDRLRTARLRVEEVSLEARTD